MRYANNNLQRTTFAVRFWSIATAYRPYVPAIFAFISTVTTARLISLFRPAACWKLSSGLHIHHYVFGIFILAFAGYVAMVLKGPRATFLIALLYGFGLGMTFDEFGMWLLGPDPAYRWSETGLLIVAAAFLFGGSCVYTYKRTIAQTERNEQMSAIASESEAEASVE